MPAYMPTTADSHSGRGGVQIINYYRLYKCATETRCLITNGFDPLEYGPRDQDLTDIRDPRNLC